MHAHSHEPLPPEHREIVDLWVSDFLDRPHAREAVSAVGSEASQVLSTFLETASHGRAPADLDLESVSHAMLGHVAAVHVEPARRAAVPELVAAFLTDLEDVGRLSEGRVLASAVRAMAVSYRARASGKGPDLTRQGTKLGRNDPCPCGSGRKYKQCCLKLAG
jgi:hypothetical protein